ncbi:phage tail assembly protein [Sapientia aquatica]|uniref:Phage tail assembly protein n=1 Tax=Sapientia aquatica TaxID=1549640 RepID=A0A4R5W1E0_9BURK|nr:phage tail assembly protein [Sapientia aquatica]TDK65976.1 phage tail assembly protein [Sapientia aquatica]
MYDPANPPKPAGAITIPLHYPFLSGLGQMIHEVTMRRPTRRDIKLAQRSGKDAIDQEDILFMNLTGLVTEDLDKLDVADNEVLAKTFRQMRDQTEKPKDVSTDGRMASASAQTDAVGN